ncbi:unnamed protein product [Leptidea sinapis]|uniref:Uncharacterized protein n=1 Tax=Leptidea sinapis TaxID=189913 RepID=A0A5E4QD90_9NEOP|nr:unnamed protein product [Leptidea sinapis]
MVAMYIIFLGILPSILLILFLMYYTKHDVLFWWKKPRKTYVHKIFSNIKSPIKTDNLNINFNKFNELIHFKSKTKNNIETSAVEENIYEVVDNDYESIKSVDSNDKKSSQEGNCFFKLFCNERKEPAKKIYRKINKDDIVVTGSTEIVDKLNKNNVINLNSGNVRRNIEIVNTGLASTTNANIKVDVKNSVVVNRDLNVRPVKLSKENIVNAGLASTTNLNILTDGQILRESAKNLQDKGAKCKTQLKKSAKMTRPEKKIILERKELGTDTKPVMAKVDIAALTKRFELKKVNDLKNVHT